MQMYLMEFGCSLDGVKKDQRIEGKRYINCSTNQKLDQQIKIYINRSKVRSTYQKFYQQIKQGIKRSKVELKDQKFQQIKSQINRLNIKSNVQNIDQQIKIWINRLRVIQMQIQMPFSCDLDAIQMQYRCNLDTIQMKQRCNSKVLLSFELLSYFYGYRVGVGWCGVGRGDF